MDEQTYLKYLNKVIRIDVDVGSHSPYIYSGKVVDINSFVLTLIDWKEGRVDIPITKIVKIKIEGEEE
jgi:hypothetical protein